MAIDISSTTRSHLKRYTSAANGISIFCILLGLSAIFGWWRNITLLKSVLAGSVPMQPITAICFIFLGLSLRAGLTAKEASVDSKQILTFSARILAFLVLAFAGLTLWEYAYGDSLQFEKWFFKSKLQERNLEYPGRMAHGTAIAFILSSLGILTINQKIGRNFIPSQAFGFLVSFIGFIAGLGFLYQASFLYQFFLLSPMSIQAALGFAVFGVGVIIANPESGIMTTISSDRGGGWLVRRLMPIAISIPVILGWLLIQGQRENFYGPEFGLALYATASVLVISFLIFMTAYSLNSIDLRRLKIEQKDLFLAALVNSTDDAVIGKTTEGIIISWNNGAEHLYGYTASETIGKPIEILFPEDKKSEASKILREISNGISVVYPDAIRKRKDGSNVHVSLTISPVKDEFGSILGASTIARDITSQKQAEESIRIAQLRLNGILDSAMDAIITIDSDQHILLFNKAAEKMFGCSSSVACGQLIEVFIPHRLRDIHAQHIKNFGAIGTTLRSMGSLGSISGLRSDGSEFPLEASISQVDIGGKKLYTVILRDVTDRHRTESVLRQSQKMQALGTLAGGIAHDFNNILSAIMGNTMVAISELEKGHPIQKHLSQIDKASTRASGVVRQILTFSRPQENTRTVGPLQPLIEEALTLLRSTLSPQIEIRTQFASEVPSVSADMTQIHQVIMNLGTNAAYAMREHGGTLEVRLDIVKVDETFTQASMSLPFGRYIRLVVSDTGEGMEKATLERIFEPFFSTKSKDKGSGLGLSVVHGIMRSHQGCITAYSEIGKGTTFHLYFPAVEEIHIGPKTFKQEVVSGKGKRVLYVDDEEQILLLAQHMLEKLGFKVKGFTHPEDALEAFRSAPGDIDILVSDLSMPGISGANLVREILKIKPDLPVILTSGYFRPEDDVTARHLGVKALLLKPGAINEMGLTLNRVLEEQAEKTKET